MSNDNRNDDLTRRFCEAVDRERAKMRDSSLTGLAAMEIKSNTDWIIDTLTPLIEQPLRDIMFGLKTGSCWCQAGIGNPMTAGEHSPVCLVVQSIMTAPKPTSVDDLLDCPDCGHKHQGRQFAFICIGCDCTKTPPFRKLAL